MRPALLMLVLMLFVVQPGLSQTKTTHTFTVDSFFSDSGLGFDGQFNRCVWVFCGKQAKPGDTLRIIKLCGGMIGACPDSWTLHHWNSPDWYLDRSRNHKHRSRQKVMVNGYTAMMSIQRGRFSFKLLPLKWEGPNIRQYIMLREAG